MGACVDTNCATDADCGTGLLCAHPPPDTSGGCPGSDTLECQRADDEARHARLAWRFVAWALGREPRDR